MAAFVAQHLSPVTSSLTDFIQVQESFWSCTHVNSCSKYTLHINLHIFYNIQVISRSLQSFGLCRHTLRGGECGTSGHFLEPRLEDHYQSNNNDILGQKDSKDSTINQSLAEQSTQEDSLELAR